MFAKDSKLIHFIPAKIKKSQRLLWKMTSICTSYQFVL